MQNNIQRKLLFPVVVLTSFFLSGCDDASNAIKSVSEKGTLDGVLSCIRENEDKSELISKKLIKKTCFRKHEKQSSTSFPGGCSAVVELNSEKGSVKFSGDCKNKTDKFITSLETTITVKNLPKTDEHPSSLGFIFGTIDQVEISPGESLYLTTNGLVTGRLREIVKNDLPYCSKLKEGEVQPCTSWKFGKYKYLDLNI